ncbi:MAG TPA: elongation factor 4, partial [Candidatus Atribacteria bacterium]|nr:elongation factor 4 [Candidatus Atribacteria bacterium]
NINLALKSNLKIIPVINKIDLASANPDRVMQEVKNISEIKEEEIILASAKEGIGTSDILEAIVKKIPPPKGSSNLPLRALIFDSIYNPYKGTIVYVKVVDGVIEPGMIIQTMSNNIKYEVAEIGIFRPKMQPIKKLTAGEVGYIIAGFKNIKDTRVGDTIIDASNPARESLPGYKKVTPLVFCSIYPVDNKEYENLKIALEKL